LVRQKEKQVQDVDWLESMNLFIRKENFLVFGGFDETLVTCEDVDFSYRVKKHGRIVSDKGIKAIHLGEASTIKEFIKKEIWRGRSNLKGIFNHGLVLNEIPSLSIPLYFGMLVPLFLFLSITQPTAKWILVFIIIYLLPSLIVLFRVRKKSKKQNTRTIDFLKLLALIQVYFIARTIAVVYFFNIKGKQAKR